jgi:mono/diheme cytochrome c family protein
MRRLALAIFLVAALVSGGCAVLRPVPERPDVARGRYLVEGIGACGNCHTPRGPQGNLPGKHLAGGFEIVEDFGVAVSSNITPDLMTGIGDWTDEEIIRAIRVGRGRDGHVLGPPMPFFWYGWLTDTDVKAIVAYLRSVPAVVNTVPRSRYAVPLPPSWGPAPPPPVPDVPTDDPKRYGSYLAGAVAHCLDCHTPRLPGGRLDLSKLGAGGAPFRGPWGVSYAANITPDPETGIGTWTDSEIVASIHGARRGGGRVLPPMPVDYYVKGISESDLKALLAYLRSLPPRRNAVPAAQPPK